MTDTGETMTLLDAAAGGALDVVQALLAQEDTDIHQLNERGSTALHLACFHGHFAVAQCLLDTGARVDIHNEAGNTVLFLAVRNNNVELVELLLRHGAMKDTKCENGNTALFNAAINRNWDVVECLVLRGADVNIANDIDALPLHVAAQFGAMDTIKLQLKRGAYLHSVTQQGYTALHFAAVSGCDAAVKLLVMRGLDVNAVDNNGWSVLHRALQRCEVSTLEFLVDHGADVHAVNYDQKSAFFMAAHTGRAAAIEFLLDKGADIDGVDKNGRTALFQAASSGKQDVIECLLDRGADINAQDHRGCRPIHTAAQGGHVSVIQLLSERGADCHSLTEDGRNALHFAARGGSDSALRYLVDRGLDVKTIDQEGWTVLHWAIEHSDFSTIEFLISSGVDVDAMTGDKKSALSKASLFSKTDVVQLLLSHTIKPNVADGEGWRAIHFAAEIGSDEHLSRIIQCGVDLDATTTGGETALFLAARQGHVDAVKLLLRHGVAVIVATEEGESALHAAAKAGSVEVAELLEQAGADVNAIDKNGNTVLDVATNYGNDDVAVFLVARGAIVLPTDETPGWSIIFAAAASGGVDLLRTLVERGADVNVMDSDGGTVLQTAVHSGNSEAVRFLIEQGVDVNAHREGGQTALHCVSFAKGSGCLDLLLAAGAAKSIDIPDDDGYRAIHKTTFRHCTDETIRLLEAGADVHVQTKAGETPLELATFALFTVHGLATVHALSRYGADWTTKCQEKLEALMQKVERLGGHPNDDTTQQLWWCTGLRACVLHWERQRNERADELIHVPTEIVQRGEASVKTYLADASSSGGADLVYRCKVCVVGPSEWGKSSLVRSIDAMKPLLVDAQDRTVGIELVSSLFGGDTSVGDELSAEEVSLPTRNKRYQVTFWDFAGQDVYQVAHALFFSRRTLYVLVVDLDAYTKQLKSVECLSLRRAEDAMDRFLSRHVFRWVRTIFARQPDAEFVVLGTKADLLRDEQAEALRVWRDLQGRIFQWKLNYIRELEKEYDITLKADGGSRFTSKTVLQGTGARARELKEKLMRLASGDWLTVSVTRRDSIRAVREGLQRAIEAAECGFPMWTKYSAVLKAINAKRESLKRSGDDAHRFERGMMLFSSLCRELMEEIDDLKYDECQSILRTLHDLGDVLWYEHKDAGQLRDFVILDPMLVIDIVREIISHEYKKKTNGVVYGDEAENNKGDDAPRIDGRVEHALIESLPLWKCMDKELMYAFKALLQHFQLAYPADNELLQPDSDLIVPSYWKVQLDAAFGSGSLQASSSITSVGVSGTHYCWEYEISADLSDTIFEQFAVQSYSSFMDREVRGNCIESRCSEFQSWASLHRGETKHDVLRIEVAGESADVVWFNIRFYLMKLEKVLDGYVGLMVSRYVVVDDDRHSISPAAKALRDMLLLGRDPSLLRVDMPWLPPDLEWYVNRAWRDLSAFQELKLMQLVRDKVNAVTKLAVSGDSQRRYPALWSLEYIAEQRVAVLRMLSDVSGKCFHVPIEIQVPQAFLAKHGDKLKEGVSLLANVARNALSLSILQTAIAGAASYLDGRTQQAQAIHNLIERLDMTTISDSVSQTSTNAALSAKTAQAILRDLLQLHNDSLDELSITEICNLECAATKKGEYVWAHTSEIDLLKDELTRCEPRKPALPVASFPSSATLLKNSSSIKSPKLQLILCIETVEGLPDWDWYKTYCTWQLYYGDRKTPLMTGATPTNADSSNQPSWREIKTPLEAVESVEMLQQCRLEVQVKRRSRIGWTKLIGECGIALRPLISDDAKQNLHFDEIHATLQTSGAASSITKRVLQCQITQQI